MMCMACLAEATRFFIYAGKGIAKCETCFLQIGKKYLPDMIMLPKEEFICWQVMCS